MFPTTSLQLLYNFLDLEKNKSTYLMFIVSKEFLKKKIQKSLFYFKKLLDLVWNKSTLTILKVLIKKNQKGSFLLRLVFFSRLFNTKTILFLIQS